MKLLLERTTYTDNSTIGKLYINGVFQCFTLEDKDRNLEQQGEKVYGETAIPRGKYDVVITYSKRFRTELPLLVDVPQFEGIRIHPGNFSGDTEGCILVGSGTAPDRLFNSRAAFNALFQRLEVAYAKGEEITIEVM
jgi:hypothetical protein